MDCISFASIMFNSITSIGDRAFYECRSLKSVTIGNDVAHIGTDVFYYCPIETAAIPCFAIPYIRATVLQAPKTIIITGGENIDNNAFCEDDSLVSVIIGDSVTNIGDLAFYNCKNLTNVIIGNNVTNIGRLAFYNCKNLTSVTVGKGVKIIGEDVFSYCKISSFKYRGSEAQWNSISKGSPIGYTIIYNYTGE